MKTKIKVAPSLLSADFSRLGEEIKSIEEAGADLLHLDVMDGHFVPNITIGPVVVKSIRPQTKLPLDVHLMIENPHKFIASFAKAGSDIITVHVEVYKEPKLKQVIKQIRDLGVKPGVVLNPDTPISSIEGVVNDLDMVLIMSVNPGFAGQKFIKSAVPKIKSLKDIFDKDIEVDGGITNENAEEVVGAGANILVAGSYIFGSDDYQKAIESLRK